MREVDHKLVVAVDRNLSGIDRTSILEVTTADKKHKKVISITQTTSEAKSLEVSEDTITLYTNPKPIRLTISADGEWHLDSIPEWINVQKVDSLNNKAVLDIVQTSINAGLGMRSYLLPIVHGQEKNEILIRQWGNVDAHIYSNSGKLFSTLSEDHLSETIETLILSGVVDFGDFDALRTIQKLRILNLAKIELFDGQPNLPAFALKENLSLEKVTISANMTKISKGLFMDSPKLHEVNIPEGITVVEEMAFSGCKSLAVMNLPKSLASIETGAFAGCSLAELVLGSDSPPTLGSDVFSEAVFESCVVLVPKGSLGKYKESKEWSRFMNIKERE